MKKRAFTLVELMIVIIIIGILSQIAIQAMTGGIQKAKGTEARKNLARIIDAEKLYFSGNNTFAGNNWETLLALDNPNGLADRRFDYSFEGTGVESGLEWVEYEALPYNNKAKNTYYGRLYENGNVQFREVKP